MSALLALYHRNGRIAEKAIVTNMLAACPARAVDGEAQWLHNHVALAHQHFWILPEDINSHQPLESASGRYVIVADVRLDNRLELMRMLGMESAVDHRVTDAYLLLMAYERWGIQSVTHLRGDFAFAIWDRTLEEMFVARDALGARGLCYYIDTHIFIAASELLHILAHPRVPQRMNEGKLAEYLAGLWHNHEETFYEHIYYCPPAHCLLVSQNSVLKWRYWEPDWDKRIYYRDDREYAAHFRTLLTEAIRCRMRTHEPIGVSLSGGLDSTSIAAIAASLLPRGNTTQQRLLSFSYVFDELHDCDERVYIEPLVERYDLDAHYVQSDDKWPLRNFDAWPVIPDFIISNPYFWLSNAIMKAAQRQGCRLLLTGHFGDMLYEGSDFWAADMLWHGQFTELFHTLADETKQISWRKDLIEHGLRQLIPQKLKRAYRQVRPRSTVPLNRVLHQDFVQRTQLQTRLDTQATRYGNRNVRHQGLFEASTAQGNVSMRRFYHACGIEYENPFYDRALLEFVMALPAQQLGKPGRTRWVLRNAMQDLLPSAICERMGKTVFYPLFAKGFLQHEQATVASLFHTPCITQNKIVRSEWLQQELNKEHVVIQDLAPLWIYLSVELWLRTYWFNNN